MRELWFYCVQCKRRYASRILPTVEVSLIELFSLGMSCPVSGFWNCSGRGKGEQLGLGRLAAHVDAADGGDVGLELPPWTDHDASRLPL